MPTKPKDIRPAVLIKSYTEANGTKVRVYQRPSGKFECVLSRLSGEFLSISALGSTVKEAIAEAKAEIDDIPWSDEEELG